MNRKSAISTTKPNTTPVVLTVSLRARPDHALRFLVRLSRVGKEALARLREPGDRRAGGKSTEQRADAYERWLVGQEGEA